MKRARTPLPPRRMPLGPPLVALAALLLSLPAWQVTQHTWQDLPESRIVSLDRDVMQEVFDRRNRTMAPRAREAYLLRFASNMLTDAFLGRENTDQLLPTIQRYTDAVHDSNFGQLQILVARIWLLEQNGQPPSAWWTHLQTEINNLRGDQFKHHQAALVQHWASCYESLGVGAGTAYGLALDLVGHPHGPLLQFIATHFEQLIADRTAAGDEPAAQTCRTVLLELLRQCVLEPDSPGVQLLAGDLLARTLDQNTAAVLAEQLRRWRAACLRAYEAHPVSAIDPHRRPALAPTAYQNLMFHLGLASWLVAATLAAAIVALAALLATAIRRSTADSIRHAFASGVALAILILLLGIGWTALFPDWLAQDLRAGFSFTQATPRLALIATAAALATLLAGVFVAARRGATKTSFVPALARIAPATWLLLVVMLLVCATLARVGTRHYEQATAAAYTDGGIVTQVPETKPLLSALRDWQP